MTKTTKTADVSKSEPKLETKSAKPTDNPNPPVSSNLPAAKSESTQLAVISDDMFASLAGDGLENVKATDILIPRISILQDLSPQVKENKPEYIEGSKVGQICDIGTGQIIGDEFIFVPVYFMKVWLEWYPRKSGKGLAAIHPESEYDALMQRCTRNEKNQLITQEGNSISETRQLFGLDITNSSVRQVFVPFASTQLKKCKRLLTLATSEKLVNAQGKEYQPPLYYRSYIFSSVLESNSEGDWHGWRIERGLKLQELPNAINIFEAAKAMHKSIAEGVIKADMSHEDEIVAAGGQSSDDEVM